MICICIFYPWRHDDIQKHMSPTLIKTSDTHITNNNTSTSNNDENISIENYKNIDPPYATNTKNMFLNFINTLQTKKNIV